jgi:hypothetical protein
MRSRKNLTHVISSQDFFPLHFALMDSADYEADKSAAARTSISSETGKGS